MGLVVVISGCTSSSTNNFDDKYISFNYPSSWNVTGGNGTNGGESLEGVSSDGKQPFIFEIWSSNSGVASDFPGDLEEWITLVETELGTPDNTGNTTIGGNNAVYMEYPDEKWYYTIKGDMRYQFMFRTNMVTDSEIQDILNSIQLK